MYPNSNWKQNRKVIDTMGTGTSVATVRFFFKVCGFIGCVIYCQV